MDKKNAKIKILEKTLGFMSKFILWRYSNACVIGITGSVGKTTTKDMIVHILKKHKTIYYTKKNYNNEIGVPLTVLGIDKNITSVFSMMYVFAVWLRKMIYCKYPEIVVVEMGIDRPGDMDYLTSIVPLDIAVLAAVSFAHSEFFESIDEIAQEKKKITKNMRDGGIAVINFDDDNIVNISDEIKNNVVSFGKSNKADFFASSIESCLYSCDSSRGLSFKLNYKNKVIPVRLKNIIAEHLVYSALASFAIADYLKLNIVEVVDDISDFEGTSGRMQMREGINNSKIIDDTYNASPKSMKAAIDTLKTVTEGRKIVVLGDMRELGEISQKEHQKVANQLQESGIEEIFLVGKEMKYALDVLKKSNIHVSHFDKSIDISDEVKNVIKTDDVILVKGSRGIHMENVVDNIATNNKNIL